MIEALTSPTLSLSHGGRSLTQARFLFRRGAMQPRGRGRVTLRASQPPRGHSARRYRGPDPTRPDRTSRNGSEWARFRTSTITKLPLPLVPLFFFRLFRLRLALALPRFPLFFFRFVSTTRNRPLLRLRRCLSYNYNPCPLHSAGSSHTTYVPRASELVATAGRSLDYAPSLFHHYPTAALAHS